MEEGLLTSHSDATLGVVVLGCPESCWRCGAITTNVLGVAPVGSTDPYDVLSFTETPVKHLVVALLDDDSRHRAGVGRICSRWSRTTRSSYISNGCRACDALQGDHFIMESIAALDPTTMMELVPVAEAELPTSRWEALLDTYVDG